MSWIELGITGFRSWVFAWTWLDCSANADRIHIFRSPVRLFDLAYYSADELHKFHVPIRLQRCICDLLASPEPFDFVNRERQAQAGESSGWGQPQLGESKESEGHQSYSAHTYAAQKWTATHWPSRQDKPWQEAQEQRQQQWQQQELWHQQEQEQWLQQWQSWQPWHAWQHGHSSGQSIAASLWLNQGTDNHAPEMPACSMQLDVEKAREYVEDFCRRRELTRAAKRDLDSLDASVAYDLVHSLEVDKKGISLKPEEWSRILSSRVATKATAGELDQTSIERIDSLMQVPLNPDKQTWPEKCEHEWT